MRIFKFRRWDESRNKMCYPEKISNGCDMERERVMLFTGLQDKNEKEIYAGDIIDFTVFDCYDADTQYRGVIVYSGSRFMVWKSEQDEYFGSDGGFDLDWIVNQDSENEVIGNIYENPELFQKG